MCEPVSMVMMGVSAASSILGAEQQAQQAAEQQNLRAYQASYQTAVARNAAQVSEYNAQDAERRGAAGEFVALGERRQGDPPVGDPIDVRPHAGEVVRKKAQQFRLRRLRARQGEEDLARAARREGALLAELRRQLVVDLDPFVRRPGHQTHAHPVGRLERRVERGVAQGADGSGRSSRKRCIVGSCSSENTMVSGMMPKTLKLTQASVE